MSIRATVMSLIYSIQFFSDNAVCNTCRLNLYLGDIIIKVMIVIKISIIIIIIIIIIAVVIIALLLLLYLLLFVLCA